MKINRKLTQLILLSIFTILACYSIAFAAGENITVVGDTMADSLSLENASLPASGSEGEIRYSTDNDEPYVWDGSAWKSFSANKNVATKIVAASNSLDSSRADYQCTGTQTSGGDDVTIETAISAIVNNPSGFTEGVVYLMEGRYWISNSIDVPSNIAIIGAGTGTIISPKNSAPLAPGGGYAAGVISNSDFTNGNDNIFLKNFRVDGNKANNTNAQSGIYLVRVTDSKVENVWSGNMTGNGVYLTFSDNNSISGNNTWSSNSSAIMLNGSSNNTISGNNIQSNAYGVYLFSSSFNNIVSDNFIKSNSISGVYAAFSIDNTIISGNNVQNNNMGIYTQNSSNNIISGNNIQSSTQHGIWLYSCSDSSISGNSIQSNTQHGINLTGSSSNAITGNLLVNNGVNNTTTYDGIYVDGTSNNNLICSNRLVSNDRYEINIVSGAVGNYLAGNYASGTINDAGGTDGTDGTIYTGKEKITLARVTDADSNPIRSDTSYVKAVDNNNVTIEDGKAAGDILVIEGPDSGTIKWATGAVKFCSDAAHTGAGNNHNLEANDILTLIWDGTNWLELSYADN